MLVLTRSAGTELTDRWMRSHESVERRPVGRWFTELALWQTLGPLIVLIGIAIIAVLAVRIITARTTRPLADLVAAMGRVAGGDLDHRAPASRQPEFAMLVDSFNSMLSNIQQLNEETRQTARMRRELEMGREIQLKLLPEEIPKLDGYDIYGTNISSLEISGDYYDVLRWGENGQYALVVGDVSGKGLPASLVMANAWAGLHSQALGGSSDVEGCIAALNQLIHAGTDERTFLTFFLGVLTPAEGQLTYVNAGHNPPYLLRANQEIEELTDGGPILGILPEMPYASRKVELREGDVVLMFTDGVSEAMSPDGEEFEEARIRSLLREHCELTAEEIAEKIIAAVREFTKQESQADDITILVVRRIAGR